jgi:hypothetical protein
MDWRSSSQFKPFKDHPMRLSHVRLSLGRLIVTVTIVGGLILICLASYQGLRTLETWGVAFHQRSTTRELAQWEREYAAVLDWTEAGHAIDMLEYTSSYDVPGPGYRSDPRTEAALAQQRGGH